MAPSTSCIIVHAQILPVVVRIVALALQGAEGVCGCVGRDVAVGDCGLGGEFLAGDP